MAKSNTLIVLTESHQLKVHFLSSLEEDLMLREKYDALNVSLQPLLAHFVILRLCLGAIGMLKLAKG